MSSPGLFVDEEKGWANMFLDSLKVYNGITFGKSDVQTKINSVQFFEGVIAFPAAGASNADKNVSYSAIVTQYNEGITTETHYKLILDFEDGFTAANDTGSIVSDALPANLRPPSSTVISALVRDNDANPAPYKAGSIHLSDGGVLTVRALLDADPSSNADGFTGGQAGIPIGPLGYAVLEWYDN